MVARRQQSVFLGLTKTVARQVQELYSQDLTLKSAVDDAGFVGAGDRMPGSVSYSPPLQPACEPFPLGIPLEICLQVFYS